MVSLFDKQNNPNDAQLIINTHSSQLLNWLGRNNVHLVGKNAHEETIIEKISTEIRADDSSLEKKYLNGLLGAVPNIKR